LLLVARYIIRARELSHATSAEVLPLYGSGEALAILKKMEHKDDPA